MTPGKKIPPPLILQSDSADASPAPTGTPKRRIPPPLLLQEKKPSLGEDLYDIFTTPGRTMNEAIRDFPDNPVKGVAKGLLSVGETVAAPFGVADRLVREIPVVGEPIADAAAWPFELIAEGVTGGEKLIDAGLRGAGASEEFLNMGMDPKTAQETAAAISAVNQMAAQFLAPAAGKRVGGGAAGKIVRMQERASRPIFQPSDRAPVDYVAPASRQLYPPRNQRFEQRPGQPVRDVRAGVPLRKVPPLLPENIPLREPGLEPIRTIEVGPGGEASVVMAKPAPIPARIEKALKDVPEKTRKRIAKKIAERQELSVGERNIVAQRDPELFDVIDKGTLPELPEGGIRGGDLLRTERSAVESPPVDLTTAPPPIDLKVVEQKLFTLRDKLNEKGRYRGRVADLTEAELLASRHGYEFSVDRGTGKSSVLSPEGKKLRKAPEVKMNERAADPILLEDIAPETRSRIQDIADEVGADIDITSLSRAQIKAAIKDLKDDHGKEGSLRAQMLIEELLRADQEGIVGVVAESRPGIGKDVRGVKVDDLLEQRYEREGITREPGEPITFEPTAAGEQGSFAQIEQAKIPDRKPSGISHERQVEGTMFEKPKTPGAPQGDLFNPETATWNDAASEATSRLKKTGLSPDHPQGNLAAGLDPTTVIDPKKVKHIVDPLLRKAKAEARRLIIDGQIKPETFPFRVGQMMDELLADHPGFRGLGAAEKRAIFKHASEQSRGLVFNPVAGDFQTQEGRQWRKEMEKAQGGLSGPAPVSGGRIISEPMKREATDPLTIFTDGQRNFIKENAQRFGRYIENQGPSGEALVRLINRDYRESAQWAGKLERDYRDAIKHLNDEEFDVFVTLADEGGGSRNPAIQNALDTWKRISKEIADRAMAAELEIATFDRAKGDFVKVPFKPMENYFPHEFDITEIKKAANREKYLERISQRYKVPKSEAEWIFNKWIRSRIEVKYGHLEHARDFDIGGWKRSRDVIPAHIEKATRRITQAELYGKDYAIAQNYVEQILNSGGDYKAAQTLFDRVVGRENYDRKWAETQRKITSWQVATKLTLLSTLNWTQLNNAGLVGGWKALGRQFARQFRSYREMREFAERAGSILESTLRMHQREALSLDGIGSKMMKLTGVTAQERWLRTLSTNIIADSFKHEAKRLGNPRVFAELQRKLKYLGLEKDISLAKVRERGSFTEAELLDIGYEGARATQFLSRPQDVPRIISNPNYKLFTQFKSFITQQTSLLNDAVLKELRHGNVKPFVYLMTMFPLAGEVALDIRSLIQNKERPDNLFMRYVEDLAATGALGVTYELVSQMQRDPQGLMKWIAGPTVSDISDIGYGVGQALQGKPKPLMRTGARQIPVPVLQPRLVDALREKKKKRRGITY